MHKPCAEVTYFVVHNLQLRQNLLDTKGAERVAARYGADMQVQNVSL